MLLIAPVAVAAPDGGFSFEDELKRLGNDEFKERVAAQEELREWGRGRVEEGIGVFYGIFRTHDDPEVRLRCRELLKDLVVLSLANEGEGYIGVQMQDQVIVKPGGAARNSVRITRVMPGTPGEEAKLQAEDLVTGIDDLDFGQDVATVAFGLYVRSKKPGEAVTLHLLRGGKQMNQKVELMKRPPFDEQRRFFFGEEIVPPDPKEVEEQEFRDWLKRRMEAERAEPPGKPEKSAAPPVE